MNIVITGASSGIGQALYQHFSRDPMNEVCGVSRRGPDKKEDLRRASLVDWLGFLEVFETGKADVIILNAGVMPLPEPNPHLHHRLWEEDVYKLNFRGPWMVLNLLERGCLSTCPCVILIASVAGVRACVDVPFYGALKAALINLTRTYAKKLAPLGMRVNCISPGFFVTNLVPGDPPPELIERIPLGREGKPQELCPIVEALIDCQYVTGSNIVVDGGETL